jgi:Zn-dependent protease
VLLAVMINAEAQAWMATLLGDLRPDAKDRFHFIPFLHMSVLGSLCYVVAGFGWPKPIDLNPAKFRYPWLFTVLTRVTGPLANFLLANIAASMFVVMKLLDLDPVVFSMLVGVNVTTAIYHLIPIPPLAAGSLLTAGIPNLSPLTSRLIYYAGSGLILAIFLAERLTGVGLISPHLNPLVQATMKFLIK